MRVVHAVGELAIKFCGYYAAAQLLIWQDDGLRPLVWAAFMTAGTTVFDAVHRRNYFGTDGEEPSKRFKGITRIEERQVTAAVSHNRAITDVRLAPAALRATRPRSEREARSRGLYRAAGGVVVGIAATVYVSYGQPLVVAVWIVGFVMKLAAGEHRARTREAATITRSSAEALLAVEADA